MWIDQRGSEVLTRNECLRLLAMGAGGVGRLGLAEEGRVVIQPVNYRMFNGDVLIQIGFGSMLEATRSQSIVSFEIDQVDGGTRIHHVEEINLGHGVLGALHDLVARNWFARSVPAQHFFP